MQHYLHVCTNGMTALLAPQQAFPLVSLQVWVGSGSQHEGGHRGAGISHLLEHMVFKGTEELAGSALNERVPELGGTWNAYTSTDRTVYHIDGPAEHWREFLHLLVQLTLHPVFPPEEFEKEREVIRREMAMYNDEPQDAAYHALMRTLYYRHPRREPVIGHRAAFDALSHADMVAHHRRHYVPGNMFICAAGALEQEAFFAAVEEEMQDIPFRPLPECPFPEEPRQWGPRLFRREFEQPTSTLMLAWRLPHSNHPDAAALSVLAAILGNGRSAWLYKRFHDELAMAHEIGIMSVPERHAEGALVVEADVEPARRDELRDALLAYMQNLPQEDFEAARRRTRRQMLTSRLSLLSTVQGMANALAMSWHLTRNPGCMQEWEAALDAVTAQDLSRVAATYLRPERLTEVSVDPIGTHAPQEESTRAADLNAPQVHTLSNGLRVVTRVDARVPLVHAHLVVGAGSPTETEQTAGINTLLAECLLKGTATRTAAELAEAAENLGGNLSSSAGNNTLALSVSGLAADAAALLSLLAEAALQPSFPEDAVQIEKEAMLADIRDAEEDPASVAFRQLRRLCFGTISYGNHRDGTVESVQSLSVEQLRAQYARLFCAGNAVLALAGDMEPAHMLQLAQELFGSMAPGCPVAGIPTPPQQAADVQLPFRKEQAVLALAVPGVHATAEAVPHQLLFEEWCRDMSGPLFAEIREKRALAYYAAATSLLGVDTGCLIFYLGTAPEQAAAARTALQEVLQRMAQEGMPPEALERARATILAARVQSLQSCGKRCAGMAVNTLLGLPPDYEDAMPDMLRAVTPESMRRFVQEHLAPTVPHTWITVGASQEPEA